jgi:putative membrane protein
MKSFKLTVILILSVLLVICIPANTLAQGAPEKEEVVYVNLGGDGSVQDIYVVNAFDVAEKSTVTDYGRYSATRNMSTDEAIQTNGDMQSFTAPRDDFTIKAT